MSRGDVTTFYDGSSWTYEIEGEPPLGHHFDEPEQAITGGRFLAKSRQSAHIVKNADGTVREHESYREPGSTGPEV